MRSIRWLRPQGRQSRSRASGAGRRFPMLWGRRFAFRPFAALVPRLKLRPLNGNDLAAGEKGRPDKVARLMLRAAQVQGLGETQLELAKSFQRVHDRLARD